MPQRSSAKTVPLKQHALQEEKASRPAGSHFLTPGKDRNGVSPEALRSLMTEVQAGDRNLSRSLISRTLNVNDVVAECCLRHLEEKLHREQDYRERILMQASTLSSADATVHQRFLRDAFGVQGIVSKAILNHWRIAGA